MIHKIQIRGRKRKISFNTEKWHRGPPHAAILNVMENRTVQVISPDGLNIGQVHKSKYNGRAWYLINTARGMVFVGDIFSYKIME